jgi:DNA segregation ATPase FtsK/SpoIIIE, S-DNA-T family
MAEQKKRGPGRPPGSKNKNSTKNTSRPKAAASATVGEAPKKIFTTEPRVRDEIGAIILIAFGVFLIIALQTDLVGVVGKTISDFLKGSFGFGAYFLPYFLIIYAIFIFVGLLFRFLLEQVLFLHCCI